MSVTSMTGVERALPEPLQSAAAAVDRIIVQQPRPALLLVHGAADAVGAVEMRRLLVGDTGPVLTRRRCYQRLLRRVLCIVGCRRRQQGQHLRLLVACGAGSKDASCEVDGLQAARLVARDPSCGHDLLATDFVNSIMCGRAVDLVMVRGLIVRAPIALSSVKANAWFASDRD